MKNNFLSLRGATVLTAFIRSGGTRNERDGSFLTVHNRSLYKMVRLYVKESHKVQVELQLGPGWR